MRCGASMYPVQVSRQQFCRHRRCHRRMLSRHSARCPAPVPAAPPLAAATPLEQLPVSAASTKHQDVRRDYARVTGSKIDATKKPVPVKGPGNRADDEGFVTVQRMKRRQRTNKNRCGTAPIEPNIKIRAAKPNTPVYISRLHYTTKAEDILEYVRQKLKYAPRVQLLESIKFVYS
ncbi:hypothetical protein B5X24_HaOG213753 [Helicoverpa armigera]|uniref:Uncharacterized protein n=1 Tax=Helicoverpa armigera TaxID=29058 RepID=A0A2W1BBQ0_HELAM|nr:hypothetical protein B5X24_HaOG213753 [Helicoverpa armigera]